MNILLNITAFILCSIWFHNTINVENRKLILPVIVVYLIAAISIVIFSLFAKAEYLDGVNYLLVGGVFLVLFWGWTTVGIIHKNVKQHTQNHILGDLSQNIVLLILPLLIWLSLSNMSLKIGG